MAIRSATTASSGRLASSSCVQLARTRGSISRSQTVAVISSSSNLSDSASVTGRRQAKSRQTYAVG